MRESGFDNIYNLNPKRIRNRRIKVFGLMFLSTLLATAAYNAGPNKVRQWLPTRAAMPADLWVETIPYRETRVYVQRVMEYAAIYNNRLQAPIMTLTARMKPVLPMEPRSAG